MVRVETSRQPNGSTHVVERHTVGGREYLRTYFAPPKADIDALALEHAQELIADIEQLAIGEKEAQDAQSLESKLIAYAKEQPVETLKEAVKLTDDEIAALEKREATTKAAVTRG